MTQEQPDSCLIPCTRPPLNFSFGPQAPGLPTAKGRCGHTIWQREQIMLDGVPISAPAVDRFGFWGKLLGRVRQDCFECTARADIEKTIVCPLCGGPIFVGMPVSMYGYGGPTNELPFWKHATRLTIDTQCVVGCMGRECCPSSGFFSGQWTGEGILSPFFSGTMAGDAAMGGIAVVTILPNS